MPPADLQTFDIGLSSGCSVFSKLIKEATGCQWSHVFLIYKPKDRDRTYVYESTGRGVGVVTWDESTHTHRKDFLTRTVNPGAGDVAIRRLIVERTPEMLKKFEQHIRENSGKPYEQIKRELLRAVLPEWMVGANEKDMMDSVYCWELASDALKYCGLLPADRPSNTYTNNDYAGDSMPWLLGARLGPLEMVP